MAEKETLDIHEDSRIALFKETLNELEFNSVLETISKYCISEPGKEIILNLFPRKDIYWLNKEHELISEMKQLLIKDDELPLEGLGDIRSKLHKSMIENAILSPIEVLTISDNIRVIRLIKKFFQSRSEDYPEINSLTGKLHENRLLEKHITEAINDSGEIVDNATKELASIRKSINEKSNRLRNKLRTILRKVVEEEIVQEDFFTMREDRFVLPIKAENKRTMPGIIHGVSQTGSTVFLEPSEIIEMNNELSLLKSEEQREMYRILRNLTKEIGQDAYSLLGSVDIMAHLDSVVAKAKYANEYNGFQPEISEDNEIILDNVKHPLLVKKLGQKHVIPLSIDFSEAKRGHLISGPNAGGKTVALKSVGLNIAMALSGIFPLGKCKTNYRMIFSAIGDQQSIENDLSTFSSQMTRIKNIIENCDSQSLVLIDEIGSGTDPQEGAALASGILDTFIELNLYFIATTHQSSLKTYALNQEVIENASLEFNEEQLRPTYRFLPGIPGNSYAFFLVNSIGLSQNVIKRSRKYLGKKEKELEEGINVLNKFRNEALNARIEADKLKIEFQSKLNKYEEKLEKFNEKRDKYIKDAQIEAKKIVEDANSLIENTIKEIREEKKSFGEIKKEFSQEKKKIERKADKIVKEDVKPKQKKKEPVKLGDSVSIPDSNSVGTVIELDKDSKISLVEFNGFKFRIPIDKLEKVKKGIEETERSVNDYIKFDASSRIDVRGSRSEDTMKLIDDFIAEALVANVTPLTIVHGKGTGALRQSIHQNLRQHPSVKSYRLGELVEGGAGVTIVDI